MFRLDAAPLDSSASYTWCFDRKFQIKIACTACATGKFYSVKGSVTVCGSYLSPHLAWLQHASTLLRDPGPNFMTASITTAITWSVLREGDAVIQNDWDNTNITISDEVQSVANHFNHGDCEIFHHIDVPRASTDAASALPSDSYDATGKFLAITSNDVLLSTIACDVHEAREGRVPIK